MDHCSVTRVGRYRFTGVGNGTTPEVITASGDGQQDDVANTAACKLWAADTGSSNRGVTIEAYEGADHDGVLADNRVLKFLLENPLRPI